MTVVFSRRDFMKCTGVTALAVAASGLLSGCSSSTTAYLAGQTATINGVRVTMKGYRSIGGFFGYNLLDVVFELDNPNEGSVQVSKTVGEAVGQAIDAVMNNQASLDLFVLWSLTQNTNFTVSAEKGSAYCADTFKQDGVIRQFLDEGKTGTVDLYVLVDSSAWKTLNINYKPPFGSASFKLTMNDAIA